MKINEIIKKIKEKAELASLDDFIKDRIQDYLKEHKIDLEKLDQRSSNYQDLFKAVRKKCFESYGLFKISSYASLATHISTRERREFYSRIYKEIFSITGKPKKILDLGCGLNPLSYRYLDCKPEYYASELTEADCVVIRNFFKQNKIKGKVFAFNLLKDDYSKLPKADICFLFKVLESLESIRKNISKEILKEINAKWIIVSFSKRSITGKLIRKKGRSWLKRMLAELNYDYQTLDIGDEIFYVIRK